MGRYLVDGGSVDHINRACDDNRPKNLERRIPLTVSHRGQRCEVVGASDLTTADGAL